MSARDQLQKVIYNSHRDNTQYDLMTDRRLQGSQLAWAGYAADRLLVAGYRKPEVIAHVVVDREGHVIGKQFKDREAAQAFADEWTADCKTAGIDWEYRVAVIAEDTP